MSSAEVDYKNLALTATEVLWIHPLLQELTTHISVPIIYCDNQSIVALSHNPVLRSKTKHMELSSFFVREKILSKSLIVEYVPSQSQVAYNLTKPLTKHPFCSQLCQ